MLKTIQPIQERLAQFKKEGKQLFVTSSFQSQSLVLLHIISQTHPDIPVYFINTGYHFPETIVYKNNVASLLGLQVTDLHPLVPKNMQRTAQGNLLFTFDPDYCCYLNKVQPVEKLLESFDIWINGVRADQSQQRNALNEMQATGSKAQRYHPMLQWTASDIDAYIEHFGLPRHPLEAAGYESIGCEPCTRPVAGNMQREGRWFGMRKTECGLNSETLCCKKE
ncbi:MAG: phosphoadenylyl-sulfate reductase [Bacteroidales bacterium]